MTRLSRTHEPPSDQSTSWPCPKMDKGKAIMLEYEDDHFDDNESTHSLDSAFGGFDVPIMRTPRIKKVVATAKEKLCRPTQEKNSVSRSSYKDYMVYHNAFVSNTSLNPRDPKYIHILPHLAWKPINSLFIKSIGLLVGATKDECIIKVFLHGMMDPSKCWLEIEI